MRLQLIALALFVSASARGQSLAKVDDRAAVYQDSDHTAIVTNNIAARATPGKTSVSTRVTSST